MKDYISEKCSNDLPVDAKELLEEVKLIRKEYQIKAIQFLDNIKCQKNDEILQAQDIENLIRTWISGNLEKLESKISLARIVDFSRYFASGDHQI